jgi:hypothetical protein
MADSGNKYDTTTPCEGSSELNGKDSAFRTAPLISQPKIIRKLRIRGALVPMREDHEASSS